MTFATETTNLASKRFILCRLAPYRNVTPNLTTIAASTYQMAAFPYIVANVIIGQAGAVNLTRTTLDPPTVDNTYFWNETTGDIRFKYTAQALNSSDSDSFYGCMIQYYLFFTSGDGLATYETPTDSTTELREWQPRISEIPTFDETISNITSGIISIAPTQMTLTNGDNYFQQFLSDEDSFREKEAIIWMCINTVSSIRQCYLGKVREVSIDLNTINIAFFDEFSRLQRTADFGDDYTEYSFSLDGGFPNMNPSQTLTPVKMIFGKSSRYLPKLITGFGVEYVLDTDMTENAVCTDMAGTRIWGLCRTPGPLAVPMNSFTSVVSATYGGSFFWQVTITGGNPNYRIGDSFSWVQAGVTYYSVVGYSHASGSNRELYLRLCVNGSDVEANAGKLTTSSTCVATPACGVLIKFSQGANTIETWLNQYMPLRYGLDYTLSQSLTSGNNGEYFAILASSRETVWGFQTLDPTSDVMCYRITNPNPMTHGQALKFICGKVGLAINSTTFDAADTAFAANLEMSMPRFDDTETLDYIEYVQDILASTLGYMRMNDSLQAEYYLLAAPGASDAVDSSVYSEASVSIDNTDIVVSVYFTNPNHVTRFNDYPDYSSDARGYRGRCVALNSFRTNARPNHCLETISARVGAHIGIKSRPTIRYSLTLPQDFLAKKIGDDLTLTSPIILGGATTVNVKIMAISRSVEGVTVQCSDLMGL